MRFISLVPSLRNARRPGRSRTAAYRPWIEVLEDRLAPALVTTTSDSGDGSLRAAIIAVNGSGGGTINFKIGTGAQTIALLSALPAITTPVTIAGNSQPGFAGSPLIELNGAGAGTDAN